MPKEERERGVDKLRHAPLAKQISSSRKAAEGKLRKNPKQSRAKDVDDRDGLAAEGEEEFLDTKLSQRILRQAQEQRDELVAEDSGAASHRGGRPTERRTALAVDSDEDAEDEEDSDPEYGEDDEDFELEVGSDGYVDVSEMAGLSKAEQVAMQSFFGTAQERRTINDLILEKIREKEEAEQAPADYEEEGPALPPKVVQVYTEIGRILKHYTAGKIPKAFKIIPSLSNWEEVLWVTQPDNWSPVAVFAATRLFASNLNERMAQRFFNLILLGRVRRDIDDHARLNYHLYHALRKSVYKPAAFFKGIVLPLAKDGCTLKEAAILSSVMAKVSIPANHSAVALLKLAEMPYDGATSMFIRVLLNKKYALPHRVVDSVVVYFLKFIREKKELPVLWHQSLLVFVQRYKNDIREEQKEAMKALFKAQFHHQITPEVRRELFSGHSLRDSSVAAAAGSSSGGFGTSAAAAQVESMDE